jgi:hypothetical protein
VGRADLLAGQLPSLWRPGPDGDGPTLPLTAADVVELAPAPGRHGAPAPGIEISDRDVGVLVTFGRPSWPRRVRLRPGLAPGISTVLEARRLIDGQPTTTALATIGVRDGIAVFPSSPAVHQVTLLLRRRHLLDRWIQAVGAVLDDTAERASEVLQAHWIDTADAALLSPFVLRARSLAGRSPPDPTDPTDRRELDGFPYLRDLARLGALVPVAPWHEPPTSRDVVESYRLRLRRTVALHGQGLGTVPALRRAVELHLPIDPTRPAELRDLPFTVEEYSPLVDRDHTVAADGVPLDLVGPLMRWQVDSDGLVGAAPTVHVQGVTPVDAVTDPTARPLLELAAAGDERRRIGLGYRGTVPPERTLRLRPTSTTWVARAAGLEVTVPAAEPDAGVTGPWTPATDAPDGVVALAWTADLALWAATTVDGTSSLWRHDGRTWVEALADLPVVTCLAAGLTDLVVGTGAGLLVVDLHPEGGGGPTARPDPAGLDDPAVRVLLPEADGSILVGGDAGLLRLHPDGSTEPIAPDGDGSLLGSVTALGHSRTGTLHVGGDAGLFAFQPALGHWYGFAGEGVTETVADWVRVDGGSGPPADPGLPPVRAVHRGPDGVLWVGTDAGVARYVARSTRSGPLSYTTVLEAFPDLGTGPVHAIVEDARGVVWFATSRGLLRADGRDLAQVAVDGTLTRLGHADTLYAPDRAPEPRGPWRFDRTADTWQRWDGTAWRSATTAPRTADDPAVLALTVTDGVVADLLEGWDPATGAAAATTPVDPADLVVRLKPGDDTRVVDGGIPAIPRIPPGSSTWRYLALEPEDVDEPHARPAWTIEGRLLPPPADRAAPGEGRYDVAGPGLPRSFDEAVFAYLPAARVQLSWRARRPLTVLVRLDDADPLDPAVLDRVWEGIQLVRPAGVRTALAVGTEIVRGGV